ncbi:low-affinity glucose transporter HXT3 [Exophiala viscosa]|uniref:low-affinity glucose transporter HXT3 n=1 Tax=Exophiala viscosa TaxID=2486360 RepID=UPI00219124E3|nr:low-affinity glucose transporter HXT3 [Exophiala viscosa]
MAIIEGATTTLNEKEKLEQVEGPSTLDVVQPESRLSKYIPGGYSKSRCLKLRGRPMMYAVLLLAGISIMFFGYDASVMAQVNTNAEYLELMGAAGGTSKDAALVGGIVSIWFLGFLIGALFVGSYADKIGRLKTIEIGCIWGIVGAVLQAAAQNVGMMMVARIIGGIGCGHLNTVVPIWTSEIADPHLRGAFVAVEFTLALTGSTLAYWMEYGCTKTQSVSFAWRFPLGFQIIFLLLILVMVPFFPESPRHLAKTGRLDEAQEILEQCRTHPDHEAILQEMEEIKEAIRLEAKSAASTYYTMLFKKDELHTRRRIMLGGGVQVLQKLTGIDFIATYAPEMFALGGFSGDKPALLAGGNFISYTASLALAIYLCDRVGRRRLMLSGCTMMAIVLIVGGILSHETMANKGNSKATGYGAGVTAILYIYTALYGSTWLTTCWVYPTEVFPLATRAKGTALATVAFSIAGGVINTIIPYLISAVNFWIFIIFAIINLLMLIPIYLFYIETANRHLEDLDILFASDSPLVWRAEKEFARRKAQNSHLEHELEVVS